MGPDISSSHSWRRFWHWECNTDCSPCSLCFLKRATRTACINHIELTYDFAGGPLAAPYLGTSYPNQYGTSCLEASIMNFCSVDPLNHGNPIIVQPPSPDDLSFESTGQRPNNLPSDLRYEFTPSEMANFNILIQTLPPARDPVIPRSIHCRSLSVYIVKHSCPNQYKYDDQI
jgi:hypothetical protein